MGTIVHSHASSTPPDPIGTEFASKKHIMRISAGQYGQIECKQEFRKFCAEIQERSNMNRISLSDGLFWSSFYFLKKHSPQSGDLKSGIEKHPLPGQGRSRFRVVL
jgi:hypothetical protein